MKKLLSYLILMLAALSLAACAGKGGKETAKVKCPACGYEFQMPATH